MAPASFQSLGFSTRSGWSRGREPGERPADQGRDARSARGHRADRGAGDCPPDDLPRQLRTHQMDVLAGDLPRLAVAPGAVDPERPPAPALGEEPPRAVEGCG